MTRHGDHADAPDPNGTVYASSSGGSYDVLLDSGERVAAVLRGRVKKAARAGSRVVIGDRVTTTRQGELWAIEAVAERATELVRRGREGRAPKVLAANLDTIFVVVALDGPPATPALIDRLLVLVEASGMRPALVLNKADLDPGGKAAERFRALYTPIGYDVVVVSAESTVGLEELRRRLCDGTSALIGPSGVGKSSLLNALDPELGLETGVLSRKTGTGKHTTTGSRLIPLSCGGRVADTPGFGDVGLWSVPPEEVAGCFPEIVAVDEGCRFRGCTHLHEPECAVQAAVEAGEIVPSRYGSYRALRGEAEDDADDW